VDCVGLILLTLRTCRSGIDVYWRECALREGRPLLDPNNAIDDPRYGRDPDAAKVRVWLDYCCVKKNGMAMRPGDLLLFSLTPGGGAVFTGLATELQGTTHVIAGFSHTRRVAERALSGYLLGRLFAVYEIRGVV
jgi:hypothetical protein